MKIILQKALSTAVYFSSVRLMHSTRVRRKVLLGIKLATQTVGERSCILETLDVLFK